MTEFDQTRGVVFYMDGQDVAFQIPVFLKSLREVYKGAVGCVLGKNIPTGLGHALCQQDVVVVAESSAHLFKKDARTDYWCRKAWHHMGDYPFDINLYFDLDHVFRSFDYSIFDFIAYKGLVACGDGWPFQRGHDAEINAALGGAYKDLPRCNGGLIGAVKNHSLVSELCDRIGRIYKTGFANPDEFAMASMIQDNLGVGVVGYDWSCPYLNRKRYKNAKAIHCLAKRYTDCEEWRAVLTDCYATDYMGLQTKANIYKLDKSLLD